MRLIPKENEEIKEYVPKEITVMIDYLIERLNKKARELCIVYDNTKERMFSRHIIKAKAYGEIAESFQMDRITFSENIMEASVKIDYRRGYASGPMLIYKNHRDILNQTIQKSKSKKKKQGGTANLYGLQQGIK